MSRITLITAALGTLLWTAPPVQATVPNQDVRFSFHSDPDDADSPVVIQVDLHLLPSKISGNYVGWQAATVHIARLDSSGGVAESWSQSNSSFDTGDGLWSITHADDSSPDISEFLLPPQLAGTLPNDNSSDPPLVTSLVATGDTSNRPQPYEFNAYLSYSFRRGGESTAIVVGSNKPVGAHRPW